ncbi:MAG: hypothetical protein NTY01_24915 [Verrucomicrobia bacterium]|nr:hypothetical protein [Verrucomicrobiota bacterium]
MNLDSTYGGTVAEVGRKLRAGTGRRRVRERLPDETKCAGKQIARSDVVVCAAVANHQCEFSVSAGGSVFCYHPRRLEIAARTGGVRRAKHGAAHA